MFSDLFEKLRDYWRATVKPAWKNLWSQKANTANTFAVLFLLELLLCVIFISYANNHATEAFMEVEFRAYEQLASSATEAETKAAMNILNANLSAMKKMNTAVFGLAVGAWFLISSFIFSKIIVSSIELRKYVYGLYITFGANTKKIRSLIFCQMMSLGLGALILAIPTAIAITSLLYGYVSFSNLSAGNVLLILLIVALLLTAVIGTVAHTLTAKTCVFLLSASDVSNYVKSPSRSAKRIYANRPFSIARISILRMRSHYLPMVISAVLPICMFFCCMSLSRSNELRRTQEVPEFTVSFEKGITSIAYQNIVLPALQEIDGISDIHVSAGGGLGSAGAHLLINPEDAISAEEFVKVHHGTALDQVKIISGDFYSLMARNLYPQGESIPGQKGNSFGIKAPTEGHAVMVYPATVWGDHNTEYSPLLELIGTAYITAADAPLIGKTLSEKVDTNNMLGISLRIDEAQTANDRYSTKGFPPTYEFLEQRLDEELLVLHPSDFQRLTGINVLANIDSKTATPTVSLSEIGSYLVSSGCYTNAGQQTVPTDGFLAANELMVDVSGREACGKYGIDANAELATQERTATLILRRDSKISPNVTSISLSGVTTVEFEEDEKTILLSSEELLQRTVSGYSQYYTPYEVFNVIYSDTAETDVLLLPESDVADLFDKDGAYTEITLDVPVDIEAEKLVALLTKLHVWMNNSGIRGDAPMLSEAGLLWDAITVERGNYTAVARALAFLLLLSVPFIWFCPQFNHYQKRRSDLETLCLLGQPRSAVLRILIWEGLILGVLSALSTLILSPLFTLVAFEFLKLNGFPFAYSALDVPALIGAIAFSVLCAFVFTVINYFLLFRTKKIGKRASLSAENVFEKE